MSERVWTETRIKAEEMLAAVGQALQLAGEKLSPNEQRVIEEKAQVVRDTLATHEPAKLKAANAALDDATQELAALIVEQAMAVPSEKR
jgi:molecular chaperone DnaK